MKKFGFFAALALGLFVLMSAAVTPAFGQSPITVRPNHHSVEEEIAIGKKLKARFIADGLRIVDEPFVATYIQRLGEKLVAAIAPEYRIPGFHCEFYVVDNDEGEYNAFATPGCFVFINKTVILSADSEGQVAGIMAHELGHPFLKQATADRARLPKILAYAGVVGGAALGGNLGQAISYQSQYQYAVRSLLPHSREDEHMADLFGAQTMARAGYDPDDLWVDFQLITNLMRNAGVSRVRVNLMDHPAPDIRGEQVRAEAAKLRELKLYDPKKVWPMTDDFLTLQAKLKGPHR